MDLNEPFVDEDDVDGIDLTPRTAPPTAGGARDPRRLGVVLVLGLVVAALGFVAWQGLSNASLYFRNADEAVAQRESLGDRRFRLQGTVVDGTVERDETGVVFTVAFNGVSVAVEHEGDPPELFQPDIPVVLEGRWASDRDVFESDRILVKHTETYEEEHPDRVDPDADAGDADTADTDTADTDTADTDTADTDTAE